MVLTQQAVVVIKLLTSSKGQTVIKKLSTSNWMIGPSLDANKLSFAKGK
jgi:hypothetical protein